MTDSRTRAVREHRKKKIEVLSEIKSNANKYNITVHCMSDEVKLYIRYIVDTVPIKHKDTLDYIENLYNQVRGNESFVGSASSTLAVAIILLAVSKTGLTIVQKDICKCVLTKPSNVRYMMHRLTHNLGIKPCKCYECTSNYRNSDWYRGMYENE